MTMTQSEKRRPSLATGAPDDTLDMSTSLHAARSARTLFEGQHAAVSMFAEWTAGQWDRLFWRWCEDQIAQEMPAYWERRAAVFDSVPDPIEARNCRRHAALLESIRDDRPLLDVLDERGIS